MAETESQEINGGIPDDLFLKSHYVGEISGLSKKTELHVVLNKLHIHFIDTVNPYLCFQADVIGDSLFFTIQTKGYLGDPGLKHPDLYASKLAHKALEYFQRQGTPIREVVTDWSDTPGRDENYLSYLDNLKKNGVSNPEKASFKRQKAAAEETWSGKMIMSLGFEDISEISKFGNDIQVHFVRKEKKTRKNVFFLQDIVRKISRMRRNQ